MLTEREVFDRTAEALAVIDYSIEVNNLDINALANSIRTYDAGKAQSVEAYINIIKNALSHSDCDNVAMNNTINELIAYVNNVLVTTLNNGFVVNNIEDLKNFLINYALPAWQQAARNNAVFNQYYQQSPYIF